MAKGKGGVGLALIALIIGAGGVGLASYLWYANPGSPQFWSTSGNDIVSPAYLEYVRIITVEFDLTKNCTLHLLYTGSTRLLPNPSSFADMIFYFAVNEDRLDEPFTRTGPYEGQDTYDYIPATLQHVIPNTGRGHYNISVICWNEGSGNTVRSNCLTVTAYPL